MKLTPGYTRISHPVRPTITYKLHFCVVDTKIIFGR